MYETLVKKTLLAGNSISTSMGAGHLNGVFISCPITSSISCSVKIRTKHGTRVIMQDIDLVTLKLLDKTKIDGSYGLVNVYSESIMILQENVDLIHGELTTPPALAAHRGTTSDLRVAATFNEGGIFVDLGSIYLDRDSELIVSLRSENVADQPVTIMAYSEDRKPYSLTTYEFIKDDQISFHDSVGVYGLMVANTEDFDSGGGKILGRVKDSPEVSVRSGEYSYTAGWEDMFSAQVGRTHDVANIANQFVKLWTNGTAIPETVEIRATGAGSEAISFLNVQQIFIGAMTSNSNVDEMETLHNRLLKLERVEPEKAKALRHSGAIPKAVEVAQTVALMEKGS